MGVENDLVIVCLDRNELGFLCRGIKIDLNLQEGSKLTLFQWCFEFNLIFVGGISLGFCVGGRN